MFKVLLNELDDGPCTALPKPEFIARATNRLRQKLRPDDPNNLDFGRRLCPGRIPSGGVKDRRHLVFAKDEQLNSFCQGRTA